MLPGRRTHLAVKEGALDGRVRGVERVEQHLMIGTRVRRVGRILDTDEMASTYLDVCFPDIEKEEADSLIVLGFMEEDELDYDRGRREGRRGRELALVRRPGGLIASKLTGARDRGTYHTVPRTLILSTR